MSKTALVTGGSRGIGLATCIKLGRNGYQVVVVATRSEENYPESSKKLKDNNVDYYWIAGDISNNKDRERIVSSAVEKYGSIDLLVNNAGVAPKVRNDLLEMTEESFDRVVLTNTKGTMFMSQLVAKQMLKQERKGSKRGTIINVSSCSAEVVSVNRGEYCVSKAGISMLTKLYAARLAGDGIFVYEVRPGVIDTDMTSKVHDKYSKLIEDNIFPIRRWGEPEDVANAILAFASDSFGYSTGNYIDIDGGFHLQSL